MCEHLGALYIVLIMAGEYTAIISSGMNFVSSGLLLGNCARGFGCYSVKVCAIVLGTEDYLGTVNKKPTLVLKEM